MVGRSRAFIELLAVLAKAARYDATILLEGETGTGKELAARALHYDGPRRARPFVPVNCGALPDTLVENELFGHCRGAYTGADSDRSGLIATAEGGTLFLDEVDSLSPKGQVTLLRFLEDRQYRPVGSAGSRAADVRVIAASNRDLPLMARTERFRFDLFYRLRVVSIRVPALRERGDDVLLLAAHVIKTASARFNKPIVPLSPASQDWLRSQEWPGNIRELENVVCQAFLLTEGPAIDISALCPSPRIEATETARVPGEVTLNYRSAKARAIAEFDRRFLARVLRTTGGNISEAARMIGTERRHLGRLLKKYEMSRLTATVPSSSRRAL